MTHFLTLDDLSATALHTIVARAAVMKRERYRSTALQGQTLALIFDKASTRTRVSFTAAMRHLGGDVLFLSPEHSQMGRGEPLSDTARVLSSMIDGIAMRTHRHDTLTALADAATIPVINALCDRYHPCQILADVQTIIELRGGIAGMRVAWVGDGNNVCHSLMDAARIFGFTLVVATPADHQPDAAVVARNADAVSLTIDAQAAAAGADVIVTDTWVSMGQEDEKAIRAAIFAPYCVDARLMRLAKADALFMHCLPAYRGMEVTAEVIDGTQSAVWVEAENRLHAQKALLEYLLCNTP